MKIPEYVLYVLFLCLLASGMGSCSLIDPADPVPAYIKIKHVKILSNYELQGTASSKVTDVWIYNQGSYQGTYEMPARFPILASGRQKIFIGAGIEANGIASTSEFYPLYKFKELDVELVPGDTLELDTVEIGYFPELQYTYFEDFEKDTAGGGISLDLTQASLGSLGTDSVVVFEGRRSMKMTVGTATNFVECVSVGDGWPLTKGRDIYLEMNYRCNQRFQVGLIGITPTGPQTIPVIILNPQNDWNKIYLRLGPYVNPSEAIKFKVWMRMLLEEGSSEGIVYIDNIKLISN